MKAYYIVRPVLFLLFLLSAGINVANAQYCTSNLYYYGCTYGDYIDNVSVGSLTQNATGCTSGNDGYSDYTSLSTNLEQGSVYTLSVSVGTYGHYVSMWIDLDDDNNFETSEKLVSYLYCPTPFTNYSANFVVPAFSTPGDHRMRIRSVAYAYPPLDPCLQYSYGEVHDYTAHLTPPVDMSFLSATTTQNNNTTTSTGSADVEMMAVQVLTSGSLSPLNVTALTLNSVGSTNFAADVTGVKVYYTGNSSVFATTDLFGSAANLSQPISGSQLLEQGTNYFWVTYDLSATATIGNYLDVECTEVNISGLGNQVPTLTNPYGNRQINYCLPNNLYGCNFAYIDDVVLNTLSNVNSYCNGSIDGYTYYAPGGSFTTSLELGSSYAITLEGPTFEPVGFGVWIDFNNDADFSDAGEFVFSTPTYSAGIINGTITIPSTASLGEHRMRIRAKDYGVVTASESCTTFDYGEAEDYTITIVNSTPMVFVSATTTQDNILGVEAGATNTEIIGIQVVTQGSISPFNLTSLAVNANGSTNFSVDVTNVKIYYTGANPEFSATALFGSTVTLPATIAGSQVLNAGTNHFWVTYDVSSNAQIGDLLDAECTQLVMTGSGGTKVPDVTAPVGNRSVNYCTPSTFYGCSYGFIDDVIFNTLSNTNTGCNGNPDAYINYTPTGSLTTSMEIGSQNYISLSGYEFDYVGFGVWIDFNNDGDFDDADEFVFASPFYTNAVQTGIITIPNNTAFIGEHRMRIRSQAYSIFSPFQACSLIFNNGESEDYTITITPPGPMSFVSATTTQNNISNVSLGQPDVEVIGIEVAVAGSQSPFAVNSLTINSNGCSDFTGDVSNVKVYYSGTSPAFSATNLFGSSVDLSAPVSGSQVLATGTNYFWVTYDLSATGSMGDVIDAECTSVGMTGGGGTQTPVVTAPSGNRTIDYCIPTSIYGCYYGNTDGVILNTLSNTFTGCSYTGSYTLYPQYGNTTTSLALGETYDIQLDGGPSWSAVGFGVWIDFNNDGDFTDNDEFVFSSPFIGFGSQFGTITIGSNPAYVGDRRMRVRSKDYALVTATESCVDFYYGETEDYIITLSPAVTDMTYVSSTTTQNNLSTILPGVPDAEIMGIQIVTTGALTPFAATSFTVNATGSSNFGNDVTNVKIYYTGNSSVFAPVALFGSSTTLAAPITGNQVLNAGTNYFWIAFDVSAGANLGDFLDAQCTQIVMGGSGGTQTPYLSAPSGSREINLCVPTYGTFCSSGDYIDNFTLNTLSNLFSGCNGNINNYIYYDPGLYTTEVQGGSTYDLTVQSGPIYGQGFGIWIDYNNNADFGDPGEFVYASPSSSNQLFTGAITIPVDPAFYGDRRMRVRCVYASTLTASDFCNSSFYYGEVEDYMITITPPPLCTGTPVAGASSAEPSVICSAGSNSTLTVSGFSAFAGLAFQWQQSPDGSGWTDIPGATNTNYDAGLSVTTYYRTAITCTGSGQTAYSEPVEVKVGGSEAITATTDDTVCGEGNVTLQASGNGDYVLWYENETGGSPLYYSSSPSDFTTFVNTPTTYYAAAGTGTVNVGNVGPEDYNMGPINQYYNYAYQFFNVYKDCVLEGVYVYPASPGNVVIQWTDQNFNVIQSVTYAVTDAQVNQKTFIPLNFELYAGNNFHLGWTFGSINLYSNDYGATYPYTIDEVLSITGSAYGGTYYFYYYDWQVNYSTLCESARVPVQANVTPSTEITVTPTPSSAAICVGSGQIVSLLATGPYTTYSWSPADGLSTTSGPSVNANPDVTTSYIVSATDGNCTNADTVTISIVDPPFVVVTATPDAICAGGAASLLASTPSATYSVSQVPFAPVSTTAGISVPLTDESVSSALPVGFPFKFYGIDYTMFYISSNGFLTFDPFTGPGCCSGQYLPNYSFVKNLIAFAWEDLDPGLGGTISYYTTGVAPDRKLVVSFDNIQHYQGGDAITAQVILYETSNKIEIHTTSMPGNPSNSWFGHTMGIENGDGSIALTVPGRNADATWTATNDAWKFSLPDYIYSWTPATTLNNPAIMNPLASPVATTTYSVTVTEATSLCASSGTVTVNVLTTPIAGTISSTLDQFCESGQSTLTLQDYSPGATISWQKSSTSGGPYTSIPGATSDVYATPVLTASTYYVAKVSCQNSSTSTEEPIIVNFPPDGPIGIEGGHCGPGSVVLGALGSGIGNLNWYYSETGNSYLGSGTPFNTPVINSTTTFWVEEGLPAPAPLATPYTGFYSQTGSMFDVTAINEVFITGFDAHLQYGTADFEIYYKPGSYVGFETNPGAWTLAGIATGIPAAGYGLPTLIPAPVSIHMDAGETYAFYIASSNYSYIYYDIGTAVGNVYASDANIQLKEGAANYYPFGYPSYPYKWNGTVHYIAPGCASERVPVEAAIYSPAVSALASDNVICLGETIQLEAENLTPGNFVFQWSPAIAGMEPQNGMAQTVVVAPPATMTFTVTVNDADAGCDTAVSVNVTVNPAPGVLIADLADQYYTSDPPAIMEGIPAGGVFSGPGVNGNTFSPGNVGVGTYTITYTYTDPDGCIGFTSQQVEVIIQTGIAGTQDGYNLKLYPNPGDGMVTLDLQLTKPVDELIVRVFNLVGQPVYENSFGAATGLVRKTFDFSDWAAGAYYLQLYMDGKTVYKKLTIQQ
jgi:hypothetical protein